MKSGNVGCIVALALAGLGGIAANAQFEYTAQIGGGPRGGIVTNAPGSYTVQGGGQDIWDLSDDFTFHYLEVGGDFDVKVRVDSLESAARWSKAGLMVRETLAGSSRMAFVRLTPASPGDFANDVKLAYRTGRDETATGGGSNGGLHEDPGTNAPSPAYPNAWLRLRRQSTSIFAYTGTNGSNWTQLGPMLDTRLWEIGRVRRPLSDKVLLGLAVSRHGSATAATVRAEFRNFSDTAITSPPRIEEQPRTAEVRQGQRAVFQTRLRSVFDPTLRLQWTRNNAPIPGATNAAYRTEPVTLADDGASFRLWATNALGPVGSVNARLEVLPEPVVLGASTRGNPNGLVVFFSEGMEPASALNPANYSLDYGRVTGAVFADNLTTNGPQSAVRLITSTLSEGVVNALAVSAVRDLDSPPRAVSPTSVPFTHGAGYEQRRITMRRYDGLGGFKLTDLKHTPGYPEQPASVTAPPLFEVPPNSGDDYGAVLSGIYVAPTAGNYTFHLASDDQGAACLATDADSTHKTLIAFEPEWSAARDYSGDTRRPNRDNRTNVVSLSAGQRVYLEAAFKEERGGDHLSVGVQLPGGPAPTTPIDQSQFLPTRWHGTTSFGVLGRVFVAAQPRNATVSPGERATFIVGVDGTPPYRAQWFNGGLPIAGANGLSYTTSPATAEMNCGSFHVVVSNEFSSATSAVARLAVGTRLSVAAVAADCERNEVVAVFDQPLDPRSASEPFNYFLFESGVRLIEPAGASLLADGRTIRLVLPTETPLVPGVSYQLAAPGVATVCGSTLAEGTYFPFQCRIPDVVTVTLTNLTSQSAAGLRVRFAGAQGNLFVEPGSVIATGCASPAIPSNGATTDSALLDWGSACVAPNAVVSFRARTTNGPLAILSADWLGPSGSALESATAVARRTTVLIFEPTDALQPVPSEYGDRVTVSPDSLGHRYGGGRGATPNVTVEYGPPGSAVLEADGDYGDLRAVAVQEDGDFGALEVRLTADAGLQVLLDSFDAAGLGGDYLVESVQVLDEQGAELFAELDALIAGDGPTHTHFAFVPALTAQELTIRIGLQNLGNTESHRIGIDNIQFSQSPETPSGCPAARRLEITRAGTSMSISWPGAGYCLQAADSLGRTASATSWTTIAAASPVTLPVTGTQRYFRLICPCP